MIHKPIQIKNLSLSFSHKTCFEDFTIQISYGNRIAIIGRNGSGKSTLLKILQGIFAATSGEIKLPDDVTFTYVPQVIEDFNNLSGGQRLNESIMRALKLNPNVLLLDEPTNHLDRRSRKNLMRMLDSYSGTLIIVSHDTELLRNYIDNLWHIDNGKIHVFSGNYDDYMSEIRLSRASIERDFLRLDRQKKEMHQALMKEQLRSAKSKTKGVKSISQQKWPTIVSNQKAHNAEETSGRKKLAIDHKKQDLAEQLSNLRLPEIIIPKFALNGADINDRIILSISEGGIGYTGQKLLLQNINLSIGSKARIVIQGNNGSGKSTIINAILADTNIAKTGYWHVPNIEDIGYVDQHYETLKLDKSVIEAITELVLSWSHAEVRRHLNDFLFRTNEEVNAVASQLSGGEKARLSLTLIAAKPPKLLILNEVTNNLDLETRQHIIEVLKTYPGAMIIISHDEDFLKAIGMEEKYQILGGCFLTL